jgi:hypothetical protein
VKFSLLLRIKHLVSSDVVGDHVILIVHELFRTLLELLHELFWDVRSEDEGG